MPLLLRLLVVLVSICTFAVMKTHDLGDLTSLSPEASKSMLQLCVKNACQVKEIESSSMTIYNYVHCILGRPQLYLKNSFRIKADVQKIEG